MANHIVAIHEEFVRDIQVCPAPEKKYLEDESGWIDTYGEVIVGMYSAKTTSEAIKEAAEENGLSAEVLVAYALSE